jgi:hypothetical protein
MKIYGCVFSGVVAFGVFMIIAEIAKAVTWIRWAFN